MMVNSENDLEVWWKDTNASLATTRINASHPINEWTRSPVSIADVHPSTSIGYTSYLYAQDNKTHEVMGYNVSWNAESTPSNLNRYWLSTRFFGIVKVLT